jgi:hypothetical protein
MKAGATESLIAAMSTREVWLHTDEDYEAISSYEMCAEMLDRVPGNPHAWKWVVISLHSAVQGFMVIALRQTDGSGPVPDDVMAEIRKADENDLPFPDEKLEKFLDLYGKVKRQDRMRKWVMSRPFKPKGQQGWSMRKLNFLRNEFIHFVPKLWSLHLSGLPQISRDCVDLIDFLVNHSGTILWHENDKRKRFEVAHAAVVKRLKELQSA